MQRSGDIQQSGTSRARGLRLESLEQRYMFSVSAQLVPQAGHPGVTDLVWTGSNGSDHVVFQQINDTTIKVTEVQYNGAFVNNVGTFSGVTGQVIARGGGANDVLDASGLGTSCTLDGGDGNNTLYGGNGGDTLIGGSNGGEGQQGSNVIVAGSGYNVIYGNSQTGAEGSRGGNNIIVGGTGRDDIYGNWKTVPHNGGEGGQNILIGGGNTGSGNDIIFASQYADGAEGGHGSIEIAGQTTLSTNQLQSVMAEWTSSHAYADKLANISGHGNASRLNGSNFLVPGSTALEDHKLDFMISDTHGSPNWLFYNTAEDLVDQAKSSDTITNLNV